jgi:chromosome segregation ATPase
VGTPNYVSPEVLQCLDNKDDYDVRKSDFWSLGVVGYEMASGTTPFADENSMVNTYSNIMNNQPSSDMRRLDRDLQKLISGLLTDVEKRYGYEQLVRHQFFINIDWDELANSCAPFVPDIKDLKDTSYFDLDRSIDSPPPSPPKTPGGKQREEQVVIGFSYAGKHAESMRVSRQFGGDDCSDIVSSLRRQNDDLRLKMVKMEHEVKVAGSGKRRRTMEDDLDASDDKIQRFCQKEGMDLRKTIAGLEKVLEVERAERNVTEKKSLELLTDLKKKWQDREEARVEKICAALEKSENKRSQVEKDLLETHKMLEDQHKEMESALGVKTSLKNKLKEYRSKLQTLSEQYDDEKKKSALVERDSSLVLERETHLNKQEKSESEKKVIALRDDLGDAKRESSRLRKELALSENQTKNQRDSIRLLKEEKLEAEKGHQSEIQRAKSSRHEIEDSSTHLQSEVRRLERENESARKKLGEKDEKLGHLGKVLAKLEEKIRPIDRLSRSTVNSPQKNAPGGECVSSACRETKDDLKMQKIEVRLLERKIEEKDSRIKFLRDVMLKEEKEAKEKIEKDLTVVRDQLTKVENEVGGAKIAKEVAEKKLTRIENESASLRKKASLLRVKEDECRGMKHDLERTQRELKAAKEKASDHKEIESTCAALKAACLELEDQNAEYETVVDRLSVSIDRLREDNEKMRMEIRDHGASVSSLRIEKNELKSRLIQTESTLKEVSAKHDDVEAMFRREEVNWSQRLVKVSSAKDSQDLSLDSLKEQLSSFARNYEFVSEEATALKEQNRRLKEETSELTTNVFSLKESNLKLHQVIEETMEKIARRSRDIQKLEESLNSVNSVNSEKEKKEAETNVQINQLRKLVDHLKSKNDVLMIGPKAAKGRKRLAEQNWAMSYEELQEQLDGERHKNRMLNEEIRVLKSPRKPSPRKTSARKGN